ncbi:hypothetical protein [Rhodohalobacter sp. 8-1]|uniref:hypothetical protein n=1 Tax=Rhodohalobacter sp. 8-1 TaxID=3131972 RepID=UPI0030ED7A9A
MNKTATIVGILFTLLFLVQHLQAQTYDYQAFPRLDVTYEHMEGDLTISPQGEIRGEVSYDIRFNVEKSDSIELHAVRMLVEDVLIDERTMDFEIHNDTLIVYLDDTFARSQAANLRVVYSTTPVFGVLRTYRGTTFSSQHPRTTRHWLPVADYPSTMLSYDLTVRHPAGKSFVMSGSLVSNEVASVDTEITRYRSATKRPVTSLFFALSDFESTSRVMNFRNFRLHVELPNVVEFNPDDLINLADETIRRMEDLTGKSYPYGNLHLVAVHDLVWEHRTFGAGTILIDANGDIDQQIRFGVMGQWAGVQLREMQWSDADALQLYHGYFGNQLGLESLQRDTLLAWNSLYKQLSADNIDRYRYHLNDNQQINRFLTASKENVFGDTQYPSTWQDFTRQVYRVTGRLLTSRPEFSEPVTEEETTYVYDVLIDLNETQNEARIQFSTDGPPVEELVSLQITQYTFNDLSSSELTFTGGSDEVVVNLQSGLENIELQVQNRSDIELDVEKPFMYWIYQLQNSESESQRLKAAIGLRQYADNPDLQLAILDMIRNETSSEVKAQILETLRMVTAGASGTSQLFLERVGEDQPQSVRLTAIRALGAYSGNERVIRTLQSIIRSADQDELKVTAIHSLADVTETDQFVSIVESLIVQETVLMQVPVLLNAIADKGAAEKAVQLSDTFLSSEFPYDVRVGALNVILDNDESQEGWSNRLDELFTDGDPRIRYRAVAGLRFLNERDRSQLAESRLIEEYDQRVASALRRYQNQ